MTEYIPIYNSTATQSSCRTFSLSQGQILVLTQILTFYSEYPPPSMGGAEEDEISIRKQSTVRKKGSNAPSTQKVAKITRANDDTLDIERGSNMSESSVSDASNVGANKHSQDESSSADDSELESQPGSKVALMSEKKISSIRKPSKRAIETALNEVSSVTTY